MDCQLNQVAGNDNIIITCEDVLESRLDIRCVQRRCLDERQPILRCTDGRQCYFVQPHSSKENGRT